MGADSDHLLVISVFHVVQNHDFPRVCHRGCVPLLCRDMGLEERQQPMQMQKAGAKTCSRQSWTASFFWPMVLSILVLEVVGMHAAGGERLVTGGRTSVQVLFNQGSTSRNFQIA